MNIGRQFYPVKLILLVTVFFVISTVSLSQGAQETTPGEIPENISCGCGKCGMTPSINQTWQTQVIFKDGTMKAFDGCRCMFGFLLKMAHYDKHHSSSDIAAVWVKDFITGDWMNARDAHYVIGSDGLGLMGKELIPFGDKQSAESFCKRYGGQVTMYSSISTDTIKPLMEKMHMKGHTRSHMEM